MTYRNAAYLRGRQADARQLGKCIWCASESSSTLCSACKAKNAARYKQRRSDGKCPRCNARSLGWACYGCKIRINAARAVRRAAEPVRLPKFGYHRQGVDQVMRDFGPLLTLQASPGGQTRRECTHSGYPTPFF